MTSETDAEIIQHVRLMDTPTDTDPRRRYTEAQLELAIRLARRVPTPPPAGEQE